MNEHIRSWFREVGANAGVPGSASPARGGHASPGSTRRWDHRARARAVRALLPVALVAGAAFGLAVSSSAQTATGWKIIGWNNLGMHCDDADYAVFTVLPPYNVVVAHVIDASGNLVTSPNGITVTYQAVADPAGSINTTSAGKTNFWDHVLALFGVSLPVDAGLSGANMPGPTNAPQPMRFDPVYHWFIADGVPITPYDDAGVKNYFPLMRLLVRDASGNVLASTDVVLPVSDEMDCTACHASGSGPAAKPAAGWVYDSDPQHDFRLNILRLHDDRQLANPAYTAALAAAGYDAGGLYATVNVDGKAIFCDKCHASNALAGTGMAGIPPLTTAMHTLHAGVIDPATGMSMGSSSNRSACYRCHPGSATRCLRGVMGNAVAADGTMAIQCQSCHGTMNAVGAAARTGWLEEPNCQSCHTGTAVTNSGQIRYTSALTSTGQLRVPADTTFATTPNVPAAGFSLFRFSSGHGGVQCEACHGPTHAEYPTSHRNDNLQSIALQGHAGTIGECATCHNPVPSTTNGGPHGMHPVGQAWVSRHPNVVEGSGSSQCRNCHGTDYRGTVLSQSFADRSLSAFGTKAIWRGFQIGCYTCHNGPSSDNANPNTPAVVTNLTAATGAGVPVGIRLQASDADGDALTLRIVSQPTNGTVGLSGTLATYFPVPGFSGTDTFTYAAWDGSTDSNLGQVTVAVGGATCTLTCSASGPATTTTGTSVQFTSSATPSNCAGTPSYSWDFGDGSSPSTFQNPTHTFTAAGTYHWTMTSAAGTATCSQSGDITVSAPTGCTLSCSATVPATATVGSAVAFTGSATPSSCTGSVAYSWNFGDGSAASTAQSPTHTYGAAGTYHWTLTTSINGTTCTASGDITVGAPAGCTVSCTATVPTSGTVNREISFQATATSSGCAGEPRYHWSFGDGATSGDAATTHAYRQRGTYRWTLTVTVGTGSCSKTGTIAISRTVRRDLSNSTGPSSTTTLH
jgi:PKD repeat protein